MTSKDVFVRKASGLVRPFGPWSTFMMNVQIIGTMPLFLYLTGMQGAWVGSSLVLAFLLVLPFVLIHATSASLASTVMPRSGGTYVWGSRILNPSLSFAASLLVVIWDSLFHGSLIDAGVTLGLVPAIAIAGIATGNASLSSLADFMLVPWLRFTIALAVILITFVVTVVGPRRFLMFQILAFVISLVGSLIAFGLMGAISPAAFAVKFDALFGQTCTYQCVISTALQKGYSWNFSWPATLAVMIAAWWSTCSYQLSEIWSGELKSVQRTMFIGSYSAAFFSVGFYTLASWLILTSTGSDFYNALSILVAQGLSPYPATVSMHWWSLAMIMSPSLAIFLGICIFIGVISLVTVGFLWHSRMIMAWSVDRIIPSKFSEVHRQYRTPVYALALSLVIVIVGLIMGFTYGALFMYLNTYIAWILFYVMSGIAAMLLPFRMKEVYAKSPIIKYRIGRMPVLTIVGAITAAFFIGMAYVSFIAYPLVGGLTAGNLYVYLGALALCIVLYYSVRAYRIRTEGIDINSAFRVIPPE